MNIRTRLSLIAALVLLPLASAHADGTPLYQSAIKKYNKRDYRGTIADCTRAIALGIKNKRVLAHCYEVRGTAYFVTKDNAQAVRDFSKSLQIRWTKSVADAIPKVKRSAARELMALGVADQAVQDWRSAIAKFSKAIAYTPGNYLLWELRAESKRFSGDWQGCITDARKALQLNPKSKAKSHLEYAQARLRAKSNAGPKSTQAKAHKALADRAYRRGDYRTAVAEYTKAIKLQPTYLLYHMRGASKSALKDRRGAIADYGRALTYPASDAWRTTTHANRGTARFYARDFKGAITDFSRVIARRTKLQDYDFRGLSLHLVGSNKSAIADLTKLIGLAKTPGWKAYGYSNRGMVKLTQGDKRGALADFVIALNTDPKRSFLAHWVAAAGGGTTRLEALAAGSDWRGSLARHALGRTTGAALLAEARRGPARKVTARLYDAHGNMALRAERQGDVLKAAKHFRDCALLGSPNGMLWRYARARLRAMATRKRAPTSGGRCVGCKRALTPQAKFCHHCGQRVGPPKCAGCSKQLEATDKFCSNCGRKQ